MQKYTLQKEIVAFLSRIVLNVISDKVQSALLAVTKNVFAHVLILKSDWHGNMDMAVDNARHDEFSIQIHRLALIIRKPCLISYIDKSAILDHKGGG